MLKTSPFCFRCHTELTSKEFIDNCGFCFPCLEKIQMELGLNELSAVEEFAKNIKDGVYGDFGDDLSDFEGIDLFLNNNDSEEDNSEETT